MKAGEKTIRVNGRAWNVFEAGTGPTVVFLHNGGGTLWNWAPQLQYFSSQYRVVAPDLPGFGRSHRPAGPLTLDDYVTALSDLLEILDCPKPILVGNCIGSSIALEYALREPAKVSALALLNVCGGPPMLSARLRFWATRCPGTALGRAIYQWMIHQAAHPLLRRLSASLIYARGEPALSSELQEFIYRQSRDAGLRASLYGLMRGLESFSVFSFPREKPDNFPPVLLGWGVQNRTLDVKWAGVIAAWLLPDHFELIEDAGHMANYEQPERINEMLDTFFPVAAGSANSPVKGGE